MLCAPVPDLVSQLATELCSEVLQGDLHLPAEVMQTGHKTDHFAAAPGRRGVWNEDENVPESGSNPKYGRMKSG